MKLTDAQRRTYLRHAHHVLKEDRDRMERAYEESIREYGLDHMTTMIFREELQSCNRAISHTIKLRTVFLRLRCHDLTNHFERLTHAGKRPKVDGLRSVRYRLF
jgi:hypothetical protein